MLVYLNKSFTIRCTDSFCQKEKWIDYMCIDYIELNNVMIKIDTHYQGLMTYLIS